MDIRSAFLIAGGAVAVLALAAAPTAQDTGAWREALQDPGFTSGFEVLSPAPGKRVAEGTIQPPGADGPPRWSLAQWSSRRSLCGAVPEDLGAGARRWANAGKSVTIAPPGQPDSDLVLGVDAIWEYERRLRAHGEPWPHLLATQDFAPPIRLMDLQAAVLSVTCRLRECVPLPGASLVIHRHAAQFQCFLIVQNRNRQSEGYGDFLWFGIPLYDSRWRVPQGFQAPDQGHGKFIYTPAGETYTAKSLHDGAWVTVSKDIGPLVGEALEAAWAKGYLGASRDPGDYHLTNFSMGWEVPGPFRVAIQTRDLSLALLPRP